MSASANHKIVLADPQLWRKASLDLRPSAVPCPGFTLQSWGSAHEACVEFLDRWADDAAGLGWTTLECFGVHPDASTIRVDFCGAMVLSGEKVSAVLPDRIVFVRTHYRRDVPGGSMRAFRSGRSRGSRAPCPPIARQ